MKKIILIVLVLYGIHFFSEQQKRNELAQQETPEQTRPTPLADKFYESDNAITNNQKQTVTTSAYSCDGRTRCSQMHSCEEAEFFINHCPGTEMDGDHDGVPCEQQWC